MKIRNILLLTSILFFVLSSFRNYHFSPLEEIIQKVVPFSKENSGVHVAYKVYDENESKKFLDYDLLSRDYLPIQFMIQNNTRLTYKVSLDSLSIPAESGSDAAVAVTISDAMPRSIGLKVAGFFFIPFMIPSLIDGLLTFTALHELKLDYIAKSLKEDGEYILPYSSVHRIAFVKKDNFDEKFTFTLDQYDCDVDFIEEISFDSPSMGALE